MAPAVLGADEDAAEEPNEVGELDAAALDEEVLVDVTEDVADELDGGEDPAELLDTLVLESVILADTLLWKVVLEVILLDTLLLESMLLTPLLLEPVVLILMVLET